MARLPGYLIRKYGVSKKAWSVFRSKRRAKSSHVRRVSAPKRKQRRYYTMARRSKRSHRRNGGFGGNTVTKLIIGAVGVVLFESFISPRIPVSGTAKNLVEMAIGIAVLGKMRNPYLKATGATLATVNAVQLAARFIPQTISGGQIVQTAGF